MDEPFDEILGPPPDVKRSVYVDDAPVVSPESSPIGDDRSDGAPPASAFVHTNANERWSQYERDKDLLRQDSARAHAKAVASASERAAFRDVLASSSPEKTGEDVMVLQISENDSRFRKYYDDPERQAIEARLSRAGSSLPPPLPQRENSKGRNILSAILSAKSRNGETEVIYNVPPPDRVRADALKVLELADDMSPYQLRKTVSGGFTTDHKKKRSPSALAGLDLSTSSERPHRSFQDRRWTIDDDDDDDGELGDDVIDIISMENRASFRKRYSDDDAGISGEKKTTTWSSRYSVDHHLMALNGGMSSVEVLKNIDREQERVVKNARNMYAASPLEVQPANGKIFGSGFTFRQNHVFGKQEVKPGSNRNLQVHRAPWTDVDLNSNGNSLSPTMPDTKGRWHEEFEQRKLRRRRRLCIIGFIIVCIAVIIGVSVGTTNNNKSSSTGAGVVSGGVVTFYVIGDVPFDLKAEQKLAGDFLAIAEDGAFVVHVGNIQEAFVTLCPETTYIDAGVLLQTSPVPVFVLPGEDDWTNCPDQTAAFDNWRTNLGDFDLKFRHTFTVDRQLGSRENFSFLTNGVLFIGLHLVAGRIDDKTEWSVRETKDARWVEEQLRSYDGEFGAVVFFGNARPSRQHRAFFSEVLDDISAMGKPALYIHANPGNGDNFLEYVPYAEAKNLQAIQIQDAGEGPPLRVTVGSGENPFTFG